MPLTDAELFEARAAIGELRDGRYKDKMYLFLEPFSVAEVPGYLEVVAKPLDLATVAATLELGGYATMDDFWQELAGIFENAMRYHAGKQTKWIAKFAKDMLKVVSQRRLGKAQAPSLKIRVKSALPMGGGGPVPPQAEAAPSSEPKKKIKLKLKTLSSDDKKVIKAKPTQPKLKLKLSLNKTKTPEPTGGSTPASAALPPSSSESSDPAQHTAPPKKPKISLKMAPSSAGGSTSRGKELPKGVTAAAANDKKPTKPKKKKPATAKPSKGSAPSSFPAPAATKVLLGLKRRQNKSIPWFLQPVSDKTILADYKAKVKHPMDISTMTAKLEKGSYSTTTSFVLDLRRIFANALIYNTSIKDSLRPVAVEVMEEAEILLQVFLAGQTFPPLLYCWKLCVAVLDTLYNLVNPTDGQPTALYFLHPVSYYCGGQFPPDYLEKITKPMDFGTVTANLLEGRYQSLDDFCNDCRLVIANCRTYYSGRDDGRIYVEHANRLNEVLSQQVEQLARYVKSSRGAADQAKTLSPVVLPVPPPALLLSVLEDLRALKYTDKATKITEAAMGPFEKPVSLTVFPDYPQHIDRPMDLSTIEKKTKAGAYPTAEDFEYDVSLVFRNCEVYNSKRGGDHLVSMAKYGARQFRRIFYAKMRAFEDPSSVPTPKSDRPESSPASGVSPPKKIKIEPAGMTKGKTAPRISITAAQVSSAALNAARAKSPSSSSLKKPSTPVPPPKSNQPVPLHIAIARVKEAFPLRRAHKSLQSWEADCARYFKELMRHPWISAARPKFLFHVPVPKLFPELSEAYAAKIRKPMDLTTVECTLLAGNRYAGPEDFVADVALVFANAVRFNKDGRDVGDPLSCAYYDASVHLLRYSRWLSMEILSLYIDTTSEHVDEPGADGLPPFSWKLTAGNRARSREEMEKIVMNEPLEKSLEGDRWTWHEAECEKLLKALRHQSDLRFMTFFIQPNYPPDYTAFIAKPMDWEKVQRTLKKRHYDKFGDVIADLRLIFANALKYNARLKGTDTVSGRAYEAAKYMSTKLEAAINRLMLSVSDRLERERIDHANAEREIEAAERAEEAAIRAAWKKDPDGKETGPMPPTAATSTATMMPTRPDAKIRLVRRTAARRETTDFEIPFFDEEDDGQHERSYFEVVKFQKAMFEKQRQELGKMRSCASAIGSLVYARLLQRNMAEEWVEHEREKLQVSVPVLKKEAEEESKTEHDPSKGSTVLSELEKEGRGKMQFKLAVAKKKGNKRKLPALSLDD